MRESRDARNQMAAHKSMLMVGDWDEQSASHFTANATPGWVPKRPDMAALYVEKLPGAEF